MWPIVFLGLLIASLAGWGFTWWRQRVRIRQLERSKEEIQIEETLVFDFLHGLGEAFTETIRAADLQTWEFSPSVAQEVAGYRKLMSHWADWWDQAELPQAA